MQGKLKLPKTEISKVLLPPLSLPTEFRLQYLDEIETESFSQSIIVAQYPIACLINNTHLGCFKPGEPTQP